jgi:integrase
MSKPYLNGSFYWIKRRVPKDLVEAFGGRQHLQFSLKTKDPAEALLRQVVESRRIDKTFKEVRGAWRKKLPIASTISLLEEKYGGVDEYAEAPSSDELMHGSDFLVEKLTERAQVLATRAAGPDGSGRTSSQQVYDSLSADSVATPSELAYLRSVNISHLGVANHPIVGSTLNDARNVYLSLHPRGDSKSVSAQTNYAVESFIDYLGGNPSISSINRAGIRGWINKQLDSGLAPATVKRRLNQFKAVLRTFASEFNQPELLTLVAKLGLPVPLKAVRPRYVPSVPDYQFLLEKFSGDPLLLFIILFGGRISEVAGLQVKNFRLDVTVPYLEVKPNDLRGLKSETSARDFPLVGLALSSAIKLLASAASGGSSTEAPLLPAYYKDRGGDALSATANKRFGKSGLPVTTHCFRHGLKDLLRRANVAEHLMDSIQGHGRDTVSRSYGHGHSLQQKADALADAYRLIGAA